MRPPTLGGTNLWRDEGLNRVRRLMRRHRREGQGKPEARLYLMHDRAVHRVNPTGRGPGANGAAFPLYIRAGKVRERELPPLGFSFITLTLPPPPSLCLFDLTESAFVCGVFVSLCVCVNFKTTTHSTTALMRARPRGGALT